MPASRIDTSKAVVPTIPATTERTAPTVSKVEATPTPPFDIKLPPGCGYIKANGATMVAICPAAREPVWEKLLASTPSLLFSLFALGISLTSYFYNRKKDKRSREQSIHDDFWIRKIISPISVEPFLKYTTELSASLPIVTSSDEHIQKYWTQQAQKIGEFILAFRTLGLIDSKLDSAVVVRLEKFDDCLGVYCGELRQHLADKLKKLPDRDECSRTLIEITISILKLIQKHQTAVGNTGTV